VPSLLLLLCRNTLGLAENGALTTLMAHAANNFINM